MKTKVNHINTQRLKYASNQLAIRVAYGWTTEDYYNWMLDLGMEFLEKTHGVSYADAITRTKNKHYYWIWFKHELEITTNRVMKHFHNDLELVEQEDFIRVVRSWIFSNQMTVCYCREILK